MAQQNTGGDINESGSQSSRSEGGDGALAPTDGGSEQEVSNSEEVRSQICVVR